MDFYLTWLRLMSWQLFNLHTFSYDSSEHTQLLNGLLYTILMHWADPTTMKKTKRRRKMLMRLKDEISTDTIFYAKRELGSNAQTHAHTHLIQNCVHDFFYCLQVKSIQKHNLIQWLHPKLSAIQFQIFIYIH